MMQNYRITSRGAYLSLGCAPTSLNRRLHVRCQSSNSAAGDYSTLDKYELKKELQTRGLSISGGREQLIHRLHVSDTLPAPIDTTTAAIELDTVASEKVKEDPVPVKKPRAVRKKKTSTPPTVSSNDSPAVVSTFEQQVAEPEIEQELDEKSLLKLAKGELQAMAAARGLAKSGTKAQIVARILEVENGAALPAVESAAAGAQIKKRAVSKKKASTASKTSSTTSKIKNDEETTSSTTTSPPPPLTSEYTPAPPLRLSEAAALKRDDALAAAATVVAALNSKRRVLEMMQETLAAAMTVTAAQDLKWKEKEKEEEDSKKNASSSSSPAISTGAPAASPGSSHSRAASAPERRRLSPDEAAKVLEEVVRRKGTGGVGLGTGNGSGGASEVDSMKTVMAGLKARLHAQEENTEQLRAAMQRGEKIAAPAAITVQEERQETKKKEIAATSTPTPAPTPPASPPAVADEMQSVIDFAFTLGKAVAVVGRGLFNSIVNKKK